METEELELRQCRGPPGFDFYLTGVDTGWGLSKDLILFVPLTDTGRRGCLSPPTSSSQRGTQMVVVYPGTVVISGQWGLPILVESGSPGLGNGGERVEAELSPPPLNKGQASHWACPFARHPGA